ncbi:MAG: TetR/AcrR family transcriptional regulator [Actinomycetota bacterium]|nr:TetR/AcrR family transcriptional regulator [Actinomycetota bacterium]
MTTRRYEKRKRKAKEEATRQRIVAATSALHEEVGPARTTVTAIANRAGVARPTVYQHFPDEQALFGACAAHFAAEHPAPDPRTWNAIDDPVDRLRKALEETYAHYAATEQMTANVVRDAELLPALRDVLEADEGPYQEEVTRALSAGWGLRGQRRKALFAVLGLALDFGTWQRLVSAGGLTGAQAAETMADMAALVAGRGRDT